MTFVDFYRGDYDVIFPASLTEEYQFYFVFFRENLVGSNGGLNVIKLLVCLFVCLFVCLWSIWPTDVRTCIIVLLYVRSDGSLNVRYPCMLFVLFVVCLFVCLLVIVYSSDRLQ